MPTRLVKYCLGYIILAVFPAYVACADYGMRDIRYPDRLPNNTDMVSDTIWYNGLTDGLSDQ